MLEVNQNVTVEQCQKTEKELDSIHSMTLAKGLTYQMKTETEEQMKQIKTSLSKTLGTISAIMEEHLNSLSDDDYQNESLKTAIIREEGIVEGYKSLMDAIDTYNCLVTTNMDKLFTYIINFSSNTGGGSSGPSEPGGGQSAGGQGNS